MLGERWCSRGEHIQDARKILAARLPVFTCLNKRQPRTVPRADLQRIVAHLAAKREKVGMSQRELSRRLGLWEMAVHEIESGQRGLQVTEFIDMCTILVEDPTIVLRRGLIEE